MYLLSGEVWKPGCCSCHDYGKGGDRRDEDGKGEVCKKMLIILPFLYKTSGGIMKEVINKIIRIGEQTIILLKENSIKQNYMC